MKASIESALTYLENHISLCINETFKSNIYLECMN